MTLESLLPLAFGKFHAKQPILLEDGLNIITGDNESGKSTLAAFILGMLYGFKKEGRTRIYRTPEFERYKPWAGKEYRGVLVYEVDGKVYRIERSLEPDITRIYDNLTGEEITHEFVQDSRKEYNFAQMHLGLSAKEFRNTIWIGQLGSVQDGDLGLEIQGKLENILQGTEEDLPFAKALAVLNVERGRIKTPRSTRAKLDVIQEQKAELTCEIEDAREREAQVRQIMVELRRLKREEAELVQKAEQASRQVDSIRALLLRQVVYQARHLKQEIAGLEHILSQLEWARRLPQDLTRDLQELVRSKQDVEARIEEVKAELSRLAANKQALVEQLGPYETVISAGLTQDQVSGLYSKYLTCKAGAGRSERHANEARRMLRRLEEEAAGMGNLSDAQATLAEAEKLQEIAVLSEREKSKLDVELEQAKAGLAQADVRGAGGWLYALSLGVLGIAIALTIVGLPLAVPAFAISVVVFGIGSYTRKRALDVRYQAEEVYNEAAALVEDQARRVAQAKAALHDFLGLHDVTSVEDLRRQVQRVAEFHTRLTNAKQQYDLAHSYWYESSQELSVTETQLVSMLVNTGCLARGQAVTEAAVELLQTKLSEAAAIKGDMGNIDYRIKQSEGMLSKFRARQEHLQQAEIQLLETAGVGTMQELYDKIAAHEQYLDADKALGHLREKLSAVLAGRDLDDLEAELRQLEEAAGEGALSEIAVSGSGAGTLRDTVSIDDLSEKDHQEAQRYLSRVKTQLSELRERKASMEKEVSLRQREGRPVYSIEEDLARVSEIENELTQDKAALDLALKTLEELSRNLRREFAPLLNQRTGEILRQITGGRYFEARISPDLEMNIIHPGQQSQTQIANLSCGTVDQCYFALRVAVAELIVTRDSFPLFLDDSFVQYDDKRLEGALKIVAELSERHQILLFSCHGREQAMAERLGIRCNIVNLNCLGELTG
ncbi:MAG TPA: AAA family ATPase [Firmicutes bacterium]|nr:AAA family ATPase [Bacillota bacterium]